jgi:hypothetical protein
LMPGEQKQIKLYLSRNSVINLLFRWKNRIYKIAI